MPQPAATATNAATTSMPEVGSQDPVQSLGSILKGSPFEDTHDPAEAFDQAAKRGKDGDAGEKAENGGAPSLAKANGVTKQGTGQAAAKVQSQTSSAPKAKPEVAKSTAKLNGKVKDTVAGSVLEKAKKVSPATNQPGKDALKKDTKSTSMGNGTKKPASASQEAKASNGAALNSVKDAAEGTTGENTATSNENIESDDRAPSGALAGASSNPKGASKLATTRATALAKPDTRPVKKGVKPSAPVSKARPRSPTKPVKLPAAVTATTASSDAKHDDGASQSRSPSRQSNVPTVSKARIDSLSKPRTMRASLPANSKPLDKSKAKPRTSLAPGPAPSGSFLERMMRPTQSSAQKVHEKVEPSSPPRRNLGSGNQANKTKRKSAGSSADKSEDDRKEEPSLSEPASSEPASSEPTAPPSDGRADLVPLQLTDSAVVQSNNVAREIQDGAPAPDPAAATTES